MNIETAKNVAAQMGFIVTERLEHGIFGDEPVMVYRVDQIGPPAMLQHWRPSPFNDRLVAGPEASLIEWTQRLLDAR
jgi:hypothetical protein